MNLLILAAGLGSRYGGEKQFDGVGPYGEYLMEYNIYDAVEAGFKRIVVVTKSTLTLEISEYFKKRLPEIVVFECVSQSIADLPQGFASSDRKRPWGTGHAVWSARNKLNETFATINADDFYGRHAFQMAIQHTDAQNFGLIGYPLKNTLSTHGTVSRGVCRVDQNLLQEIQEYIKIEKQEDIYLDQASRTIFTGEELVSMNMWVLGPSIFQTIQESFIEFLNDPSNSDRELFLPFIIQQLIDNGKKVEVHRCESEWMGLTYAEDKIEVKEKLTEYSQNGLYPTPLWK